MDCFNTDNNPIFHNFLDINLILRIKHTYINISHKYQILKSVIKELIMYVNLYNINLNINNNSIVINKLLFQFF